MTPATRAASGIHSSFLQLAAFLARWQAKAPARFSPLRWHRSAIVGRLPDARVQVGDAIRTSCRRASGGSERRSHRRGSPQAVRSASVGDRRAARLAG